MSIVLDASALFAHLKEERGADRVQEALDGVVKGLISTVNLAEVLSVLAERGESPEEAGRKMRESGLIGQQIEVRALDESQALEIAKLRPLTRPLGLSLGDRACLALAKAEGATVLTADREWAKLKLGVPITVIR